MRTITAFAITALTLGCDGAKYDYAGFQTHKYFPLDGETRQWIYYADDEHHFARIAEMLLLNDEVELSTFHDQEDLDPLITAESLGRLTYRGLVVGRMERNTPIDPHRFYYSLTKEGREWAEKLDHDTFANEMTTHTT